MSDGLGKKMGAIAQRSTAAEFAKLIEAESAKGSRLAGNAQKEVAR